MNQLLAILTCYALSFNIYDTKGYENNRYIIWNQELTIDYSVFMASSKDSLSFVKYNSFAPAALIQTDILCSLEENDYTVPSVIIPIIDRNRSWYDQNRIDIIDSLSLLSHEKLHFDISELFARRIRRNIDSLNTFGITSLKEYESVINENIIQRNSLNSEYDIETIGGSVVNQQKKWEKFISKKLLLLAQYSTDKYNYSAKDLKKYFDLKE